MKNQKLNKEFYRMQQLAGIINESSDLTADQIALNYSNTSPNTPPGATPGEIPLKDKIREILNSLKIDEKLINNFIFIIEIEEYFTKNNFLRSSSP